MNAKLEVDETTVLKFVQDFFLSYDRNRHVLHTLFTEDGTFIVFGNRMSGHLAIQQSMLTMTTTTHEILSVDIQKVENMPMPENSTMFQVLCAGNIEFGSDGQIYGFIATILVYFQKPNILNAVSFNERCQWPKLS